LIKSSERCLERFLKNDLEKMADKYGTNGKLSKNSAFSILAL